MTYLLGVDEAGYGPNMGPLVIGLSAWQVPERVGPEKLFARVSKIISQPGGEKARKSDDRLAIGDSKLLYKPAQRGASTAARSAPLRLLERGVRAILGLLDRRPARWREIWSRVDPADANLQDAAPWHDGYDEQLPVDCGPEAEPDIVKLGEGLARADVRCRELRARAIFPAEFNGLVERHGNKAEVLSLATLALVRGTLERLPNCPAIVTCDKHGGRDYYAGLLQHVFPDELVKIRRETPELGVYQVQHAGRTVEFRFLVSGERMLPTALASMTAKYLRELAMRPFNAFWQRHVPGLAPTAGYHTDSWRFLRDIRAVQERLQIDQRLFWRSR
ncbi:MAG TPA: hypothetical protein VFV87_03705 [Pirellulaceae bacterium]|nr:hypothetical protein [Pirellulaceae bacterium]